MITFDRKFGDGAAALLMNTKFVTLIEDNFVPLAEKQICSVMKIWPVY